MDELHRQKERLALVERVTNAAVWDLDLETKRLEWNDNITLVFGYQSGVAGNSLEGWSERVHPHDRERVLANIERAMNAPDEPWTEEYRFKNVGGEYIHVLARTLIIHGTDGKPTRMMSSMLDINERKEMQARLHLTDRMASVGTLAAGVAHEINNPLTYVIANISFAVAQFQRSIGLAHGIEFDGEDDSRTVDLPQGANEIVQALAEAQEGAERVRLIVRDLKLFSRPNDEVRGPVNMKRIVESSISMAQNEIKHRAELVRDLRDVPSVIGNEARLGQVVLNLLVNAAQAIPEGNVSRNRITVATYPDAEGRAIFEVRDSGCGIAAENLGRIFDPFFTTKPVGVGTGLGLPICHGIIAALGGTIEVESVVGRGSVFRVTLPASPDNVVVLPKTVVELPPKGRVLVVDDEPLVAKSVQRILQHDQDVVSSSNGVEALARIRAGERFDVILCDLMMPKMSGMEFYEQLKGVAHDQREKIVFISGGAFSPIAREFLQGVPNRKLDKPFDAQPLRTLVREIRTTE